VAIISFDFDPNLREAFLDFGYEIYQGDRSWIAPFRADLCRQLAPDFPFYSIPGNRCRHFLATAGQKVAGRVSAMVNSDLRDGDGTLVGTIGFFECIQDYAIAKELLDAATLWLRDEGRVDRIWGPMNFDIWHGYRFMTAGFDEPPFYGEPYNKSYYPDYFQLYGFVARENWYSIELAGRRPLENIISFGIVRHHELIKDGYRFEPLNKAKFPEELLKLHTVLSISYQNFLGYTPISAKEFSAIYSGFRYAADPRFFIFAYDKVGALAGFAGAFFELAQAVRLFKGKETLLGRIRFFLRRRRPDRINFYIIGLTPTESAKKSGLGRAMTAHILRQVLAAGYEKVLFPLIVQGNRSWRLLGKDLPAPQRQYRLFELKQ
jgi:hypothetical protein